MLPACVGLIPFGLVTGIGAAGAGADWLRALGMSAIIFSGAAQLFATGAPVAVIILTCFVAGLRFLMYSAAMAPYLKPLSARWQQGLAFLLTDQVFAASIRRFNATDDPHAGASHFLGGGAALWGSWQITNLIGFFAGVILVAPGAALSAQTDARIPAAVLASVVTYRTHSTLKTLAAGMGALWALQTLLLSMR